MLRGFIPATRKETDDLGWKKCDIVIVTGDAYIDHPYFLAASAGRFLNSNGFKTAILDMPEPDKKEDWQRFGKPDLFFLVISGHEDSMAMNYTAFKKFRSTDPYVPGGVRTHRPDRALIKYCNKLKELYKDTPIVLAGPEAVCRISTHYDFWSEKLRKPILFDTKADLVVFGNTELNLLKVAELLKSRQNFTDIKKLNGMAYIIKDPAEVKVCERLATHEGIEANNELLADHHLRIHLNQNPHRSVILTQKVMDRFLVIQKSQPPMTEEETDSVFDTGFKKRPHPKHKAEIPIYRFISDIVMTHRGCLNDIADSQDVFTAGRFISSRSNEAIRKEIVAFTKTKDYNKILRIFGLPYFNQYAVSVGNKKMCSECSRLSCSLPDLCPNIKPKNEEILKIAEGFDKFPNVRNNYFAGKPDLKLLLSDKLMYMDYLTNRNDGNVEIEVGSFLEEARMQMGLNGSESIVKDIKFLIKRFGEYGKNINLKAALSAGAPMQNFEEADLNVETMRELGITAGDVRLFIPLPMTLASVQYFLGKDIITKSPVAFEKKHTVLKKISDKYKKEKKIR
jgi:uncharacterized radical SAM protein YgiQ